MKSLSPAISSEVSVSRFSTIINLRDGARSAVHVVRYRRNVLTPKIVVFPKGEYLIDWCETHNIDEAIVGGFFLRSASQVLGDFWIDGKQLSCIPVDSRWSRSRGSLSIDTASVISLGPRRRFPAQPAGSLLQAGPLLVYKGISMVKNGEKEGISAASYQFDSDITDGRYPRAAIGVNREYIWTATCDGRTKDDAGMTLQELAELMMMLGAQEALNLDGGGSATQISGGRLRNHPRGDNKDLPKGRKIFSAVIFEEQR